jgi:hypothetical protein
MIEICVRDGLRQFAIGMDKLIAEQIERGIPLQDMILRVRRGVGKEEWALETLGGWVLARGYWTTKEAAERRPVDPEDLEGF